MGIVILVGFFLSFSFNGLAQIPASQLIIEDSIQFAKEREGFINQLVQPLRFRENRINRERTRVVNLIRQLTESSAFRIDSTTVNDISDELLHLANELGQSLEESKNMQAEIQHVLSDLDTKASRVMIDSIQNQLGTILQGLIDDTHRESTAQRNEIREKLKDIKNIQNRCGSGNMITMETAVNDSTTVVYYKCLDTKMKVFGWHNAWAGDVYENYNFNYLTDIIYYGYELGADGNIKNPSDMVTLRESRLSQLSSVHNVGISLSVYSKSPSEISRFLRSNQAKENFINQLDRLVTSDSLSGLNIYFEDLPLQESNLFSSFVSQLKGRFSTDDKEFLITLTLPSIAAMSDQNKANAYDFAQLNSSVDYFLVQTNKLKTTGTRIPGSPSPLFGQDGVSVGTVESTLGFYTNGRVPLGKLVMTVTYLGISWQVPDFLPGSPSLGGGSYMEFKHIQDRFLDTGSPTEPPFFGFDHEQVSSYYNYVENGRLKKVWFEDGNSLFQKYNYALDANLGGVAIWGLGYDDGYLGLWDALGAALVDIDSVVVETKGLSPIEKETDKLSFLDYLLIYFDDLQWASVNDILFYRENILAAPIHCNAQVIPDIEEYKVEDIWNTRKEYDFTKGPTENRLDCPEQCNSLLSRWEVYTVFHGYSTVGILVLLILTVLFILWKIRTFADDWHNRRLMITVAIIIAIFLCLSLFLRLFFNIKFPVFGAGAEAEDIWIFLLIFLIGIALGYMIHKLQGRKTGNEVSLP